MSQTAIETGTRHLLNLGMKVATTEAEGPGRRFALWVQGCPMRCPGCCNPHLLEYRPATEVAVDDLAAEILALPDIEGVTFLGGEPFTQAAALADLARQVRTAGKSVMIFSGFTLEQLQAGKRADWAELLAATDLLVDGPYREEEPERARRWIGSQNQRIHFLSSRYDHLRDAWPPAPQTIEIRVRGGEILVNGFPHPDILALLNQTRK